MFARASSARVAHASSSAAPLGDAERRSRAAVRPAKPSSRREIVRGSVALAAGDVAVDEARVHDDDEDARGARSRRDFLAAQIIASASWVIASASLLRPSRVLAADADGTTNANLPKDYYAAARAVTRALTESLEFEASNPTNADRFKRAEPAKEAVKTFIKDWASSPLARGDRARDDIVLAVQELSAFYKANGSRVALSDETRRSVLDKLYDASEALPPAEKTLADRLLGL